jgi:glycosyltransferase involved in cell wall biosynthesis
MSEPKKNIPIPAVPADGLARPFWSVMIPTYNPPADYLAQTLRSVLDQAPAEMQIEVVDDCSPDVDVAALVRGIAGDRVSFYRSPVNQGLAAGWNTCIERARGEWVHILHQDDLVISGFYERFQNGLQTQPAVGAAFCRHALINSNGHWLRLSELHQESAGPLENAQEKIAVEQIILTPSIVVRRSTYEQLGGFSKDLCYVMDWEMWQRIAARFSIWFEPGILAAYRIHQASATSRLIVEAADVRDVQRMIATVSPNYPKDFAEAWIGRARDYYAKVAVIQNRELLVGGHWRAAWRRYAQTLQMSPGGRVLADGFSLFILQLRLIASRLKRRLKSNS